MPRRPYTAERLAEIERNNARIASGQKPIGRPRKYHNLYVTSVASTPHRFANVLKNPDIELKKDGPMEVRPLTVEQRRVLCSGPRPEYRAGPRPIGKVFITKHEQDQLNDVQRIVLGLKPRSRYSLLKIFSQDARPEDERRVEGVGDLSQREIVDIYERNGSSQTVEQRLKILLSDVFDRYQRLWLNKR